MVIVRFQLRRFQEAFNCVPEEAEASNQNSGELRKKNVFLRFSMSAIEYDEVL